MVEQKVRRRTKDKTLSQSSRIQAPVFDRWNLIRPYLVVMKFEGVYGLSKKLDSMLDRGVPNTVRLRFDFSSTSFVKQPAFFEGMTRI